jgi:hypothetical protein
MIPYMLVSDAVTDQLYTFGGFHVGPDGLMEPANTLWSLDQRVALAPAPPATITATPSATPSQITSAGPTATPVHAFTSSPTPMPKPRTTQSPTPPAKAAAARPALAIPSQTPAKQTGTAPLPRSTVVKTITSGPYKLVLKIGPLEKIFTKDQARRLHPKTGEIALVGTKPAGVSAPNHYLALYIFSLATGATVSNMKVTISIVLPNGTARLEPTSSVMQGIGVGPSDRHYGANVSLPNGPYRVLVQVEEPSSSFDFS